MMTNTDLKIQIDQYLIQIQDVHFLKVVRSMLSTYVEEKKDEVLGYDFEGNPKYAGEMQNIYHAEVKAALEKNEFTSVEDLKEKSKPWTKPTKLTK